MPGHGHADQGQGNAEKLTHGQPAEREVTEMGVRQADELHREADDGITYGEHRRDCSDSPGFAREPPENREQDDAFQRRLVQLARVARFGACGREDHSPRQIGGSSPKLAVDEVSDPAEEQSDGHHRCAEIDGGEPADILFPPPQPDRDQHPDQAAVKTHPALPDAQDHPGVGQKIVRVIEQGGTQPAADDGAEGTVEQQVTDLFGSDRRVRPAGMADAKRPEPGESQHVHEAVPVDAHGAYRESDRVPVKEHAKSLTKACTV